VQNGNSIRTFRYNISILSSSVKQHNKIELIRNLRLNCLTLESGLLCKLHHCSPIRIIIHHMYLLCRSVHRTTLQTTIFNLWYFIFIAVLPFNHNFKQNMTLTAEWSTTMWMYLCSCTYHPEDGHINSRNMSRVAI
jgi:hypothetical protein